METSRTAVFGGIIRIDLLGISSIYMTYTPFSYEKAMIKGLKTPRGILAWELLVTTYQVSAQYPWLVPHSVTLGSRSATRVYVQTMSSDLFKKGNIFYLSLRAV